MIEYVDALAAAICEETTKNLGSEREGDCFWTIGFVIGIFLLIDIRLNNIRYKR